MSEDLNAQELDQLRQHLIVPLAVTNILEEDLEIQPDMHYGLHLALSEVGPDSALLAIALCATDIGKKTINISPIAVALLREATEILNDYGSTWMLNNINAPVPSSLYSEILETVPEDLEGLSDLMDALYVDIEHENQEIASLLKLFNYD